jgi:hypothetical protein
VIGCDEDALIQILCFWTLPIVLVLSKTRSCLFFQTQSFGDWIVSIFRWNLFIWAQSIELVPISGRAVAQAVSRWLPIAVVQVRFRAACGDCGGQSGIGAGFLRVLRIPLLIIPPISPSS